MTQLWTFEFAEAAPSLLCVVLERLDDPRKGGAARRSQRATSLGEVLEHAGEVGLDLSSLELRRSRAKGSTEVVVQCHGVRMVEPLRDHLVVVEVEFFDRHPVWIPPRRLVGHSSSVGVAAARCQTLRRAA